jgi:hypothetical protein
MSVRWMVNNVVVLIILCVIVDKYDDWRNMF